MIRPPKVTHIHVLPSDRREELCLLCGSSLHMSKGEVRLLCYYAHQSSGFEPALQHIANKIGVSRFHVQRARAMLQRHGVIAVDDVRVYIDWERIRLFSTLDPDMTNKHCTVAPVNPKKCAYKIYIPSKGLIEKLRSCSQEDACLIMSALPKQLYEAVRNRFIRDAA